MLMNSDEWNTAGWQIKGEKHDKCVEEQGMQMPGIMQDTKVPWILTR